MRFYKLNAIAGVLVASATVLACGTLAQIGEATTDDPTQAGPTPPGSGPVPPGQRTDKNITIIPADMDFGAVACGKESAAKVITISNTSTAAAPYEVVVPDGAAFRIEGEPKGTVVAGSPVHLSVYAKPGTAGELTSDFAITAGEAIQNLRAKTTGTGATFEILPPSYDFGDVRMQSGAGPVDIDVTNNGTEAAVISGFEQSADFTVTLDTNPLHIDPKTKAKLHATLTPAMVVSAPLQAALKPMLAQGLCGAPPVLTLKGKRVNSNVTLSSGDFQKVNCTQTVSKDIVISNYSMTALTYVATLQATSAFNIVSGASGSIPAGNETTPSTVSIKVQPKPFGTNLTVIQENLTVDITGLPPPAGGPRVVPLRVDVRGAIVTFNPTSILDFTSDGVTEQVKSFSAQNTGNETILTLLWYINPTQGNSSSWSGNPPSSLSAGQTRSTNVGFKPTSDGTSQANLEPVRSVNLFTGDGAVSCTPLSKINLKGVKP